jgi:hypothetical protein
VDLEGTPEALRQRRDDLVRYAREREEEWTNMADLFRALEEFGEAEAVALGRFNEVVDLAYAGELTDAEFARIVELEVLQIWRTARERLDGVGIDGLAEGLRKIRDRIGEYARTREEAFVVVSEGAREGDNAKVERGAGLMQDADRIGEELAAEGPGAAASDAAAAEPPP